MPKTKLKEFVEEKVEPSDVTTAMAMFVKNYGYLQASLPHSLLLSLKEECSVVQEKEKFITGLTLDYENTTDHYELGEENKNRLFDFVKGLINTYEANFDYIGSLKFLDNSLPFVFGTPWVNVQEGPRYIPVHVHDGVYSYTAWINLPPKSLFEFLYPSTVGTAVREAIYLTPKDEGKIILFPAQLQHCVHPFSHDSKRISISGNILLGTEHDGKA